MLIANQTITVYRTTAGAYDTADGVYKGATEDSFTVDRSTIQALSAEELLNISTDGGLRSRAQYLLTCPGTPALRVHGAGQRPDEVLFKGERWLVYSYGDYPNLFNYAAYVLVKPELTQ